MSSAEGRAVSRNRHQRRPGTIGRPALEAAKRECQATGVGIVPAGLVELGAVPGNVRQPALVHLAREETAVTSCT